jgi:predicted nucleic acid-binding protein
MAQGPSQVARSRALVLDANILLRAVLGPRARGLIDRYSERVPLLIPTACVEDVREYLPVLCARRGWSTASAIELLEALLARLHVIDTPLFAEFEADALRRIGSRDPEDWPVVALALAIDAPVWTEDTDFFGSGIAIWTTMNVEVYLGG